MRLSKKTASFAFLLLLFLVIDLPVASAAACQVDIVRDTEKKGVVTTTKDVSVRVGPAEHCEIVGEIPANMTVRLKKVVSFNQNMDKDLYYLVEYGGDDNYIKGFIPKDAITTDIGDVKKWHYSTVLGKEYVSADEPPTIGFKRVDGPKIYGVMLRDEYLYDSRTYVQTATIIKEETLVEVLYRASVLVGYYQVFIEKYGCLPVHSLRVLSQKEYDKLYDEQYPFIYRDATVIKHMNSVYNKPYYGSGGNATLDIGSYNVKVTRQSKDGSWYYIAWTRPRWNSSHKGWVPSEYIKLGATREELAMKASEEERLRIEREARTQARKEFELKKLEEKEKERKEAERNRRIEEIDQLIVAIEKQQQDASDRSRGWIIATTIYAITGFFLLLNRRYRDATEKIWIRIYRYLHYLVGFPYLPHMLVISFVLLILVVLLNFTGLDGNIYYYLFALGAFPAFILIAIGILVFPVTLVLLPGLFLILYRIYEYYRYIRPDVIQKTQEESQKN